MSEYIPEETEQFFVHAEETMKAQKPYLVDCDLARRIRVMREYRHAYLDQKKSVDYINLMIARLLERTGEIETYQGVLPDDMWDN
jgi:hypothetical protein